MPLTRRVYLAIALFHAAALMFQLLLTRIFAITIFYHFAFMVISLVMLGLSVAGLLVHFLSGSLRVERLGGQLAMIAMIAGLTVVLVFHFYLHQSMEIWEFDFSATKRLAVAMLIFTIPQVLIGLISSLLFHHFPQRAGRIYAADLAGAGIGCALTVLLSRWVSGLTLICVITIIMCAAGVLFASASRWARIWAWSGLGVSAVLFAWQLQWPYLVVRHNKMGALSPEESVIVDRWNPISRVTVMRRHFFELTPLGPETNEQGQRGYNWDGFWIDQDSSAGTPIFPWGGSASEEIRQRDHLRSVIHGFAHHLASREEVFIIGIGGGKDIMTALTFGSKQVDAAEINPSVVAVLTEDMPEFVGNLLTSPNVNAQVGEGRSTLLHSGNSYDLIQLTYVDSFTATLAGCFAMVENHLYTREAFDTYFDRLKPGGVLSIIWWNQPTMPAIMARLYLTGAEALRAQGVEDPTQNILFVSDQGILGNVIFRREPFSAEEAAHIRAEAERMGLTARVIPGEMPEQEFLRDIVAGARPGADLKSTLEELPINVAPVTDDGPYIHFIHRFTNWRGSGVPPELQPYFIAPKALTALVITLSVLCLGLIVFPLIIMMISQWHDVRDQISTGRLVGGLLYFSCLGAGYLLIEIALIHRFIVYLGHPLHATSVVLATLLLASGLGSALLARPQRGLPRLAINLAVLIVLAAVCLGAMAPVFDATRPWPLAGRVAVAIAITSLIGVFMGTPFPLALELLAARRPAIASRLSPWLWGVNGAAGTFASVASILLSVYLGFTACLAAGAACYLVAIVSGLFFLSGESETASKSAVETPLVLPVP